MNTILVNCSKDKAEVSDANGKFLSRVANGINIKIGDEISVEQIAVNSIGVGSDIIEIPSQILDYHYHTNRFNLKTAFYIEHNFKYTCSMPLANTTGTYNGGDIGINSAGLPINRSSYGFLTSPSPAKDIYKLCPRNEALDVLKRRIGKRHYLIDKVKGSDTPAVEQFPCDIWFDFVEANVPVEISIGYDNPANIAAKITEDLHSIDLHPKAVASKYPQPSIIVPPPEESANLDNTFGPTIEQSSISAANSIIQTRPVNFTNGDYSIATTQYSGVATTNPYLWKYGTRLINTTKPALFSFELGQKHPGAIDGLFNQFRIPNQQWIYNLYDLQTTGAGATLKNQWDDGYVIPSSLAYNAGNIEVLAKFIHSQSYFKSPSGLAEPHSDSKSYINASPDVAMNQKYSLRLGRTNDYFIPTGVNNIQQGLWAPESWNAAPVAGGATTLAAPLPPGAAEPSNINIQDQNAYFRRDLWEKRYLGTANTIGNFAPAISVNINRPYKAFLADASAPLLVVDGVGNLDPLAVARHFNINITPVRISGANADGTPGVADEYVIGIIMTSIILPIPVPPLVPIRAANFMLVDLGMTQQNNYCVQLLNWQTKIVQASIGTALQYTYYYADAAFTKESYINQIQVGSPNALFLFDSGRGRFAFQDLHWKKYTGNGYPNKTDTAATMPDVNASADVAINAYNEMIKHFINPKNTNFGSDPTFYLPYLNYTGTNSGIGLLDVGLYPTSKGVIINAPPVVYLDTLNSQDQIAAYNGSLLNRFGFDYKLLFNELGFPDIRFNSKYYNNEIPSRFVQFYPSPLTTNPLVDTAMALNYGLNNNIMPNFDLNMLNGAAGINASSQSSAIFASNLPQKLVFPFWLIHSDIIGGVNFHSENSGATSNIVAICNRAYVSGDFAFSFATDYTFTATSDFVLSGINTQILNPDLTPADVNDKTSIVYKIQQKIPMFLPPKPVPSPKQLKLDAAAKKKADKLKAEAPLPPIFNMQ